MSRLSAVRALPEGTVVADDADALWTTRGSEVQHGARGTRWSVEKFVERNFQVTIIARPDGRDVGKVI